MRASTYRSSHTTTTTTELMIFHPYHCIDEKAHRERTSVTDVVCVFFMFLFFFRYRKASEPESNIWMYCHATPCSHYAYHRFGIFVKRFADRSLSNGIRSRFGCFCFSSIATRNQRPKTKQQIFHFSFITDRAYTIKTKSFVWYMYECEIRIAVRV